MKQKVLVVDDEAEVRELVSWILSREGYVVEGTDSGLDAISMARISQPDLVVMDLILPDLDGTAVCEILHRLPSTNSIPVIMLTGCATPEAKEVALGVGVYEYLVKPFSPRALVAKVNSLLQPQAVVEEVSALDETTW